MALVCAVEPSPFSVPLEQVGGGAAGEPRRGPPALEPPALLAAAGRFELLLQAASASDGDQHAGAEAGTVELHDRFSFVGLTLPIGTLRAANGASGWPW